MPDHPLPDNSLFFEAPWLKVAAIGPLPVIVAAILIALLIAARVWQGARRRKDRE
jgi:hypothetical protein